MRLKWSKITGKQTEDLLRLFVAGVTARAAADLAGVNRNTATAFFQKLREKIAKHQEEELSFYGEVEVDESYFGGRRKGKRGRGAGGKVYTQVIENAKAKTLVPIIKKKVEPDSIVYSDTFRSYNSLAVEGYRHVRINHSLTFATSKRNHINGIENFWNQAKRHLRKFNGVPKHTFHLYLKECEWRFNNGSPKDLLVSLRKILRVD